MRTEHFIGFTIVALLILDVWIAHQTLDVLRRRG